MRLFVLFIFMAGVIRSQDVLFEGHVLEHENGKPIPYANLSFLNSLKGTSSNEEGYFYLDVPASFLEKKVHISSLGFKDTIIPAKVINSTKKVNMVAQAYELDEVVISKNLGNTQVLNPISSYSIQSGFSSAATPWVLALYFPNVGSATKYLEQVTVHIQKDLKFRQKAKFRLRIYDVDISSKKPNNDLLRKSIILESSPNEDFVTVDLASAGIKVPREGLYVGLEWLFLPFNWYSNSYEHPISKKKIVEDRFAPTFAAVYQKNQNYRTMVYGLGEWSDFAIKSKNREENLIPAVSVKIANK